MHIPPSHFESDRNKPHDFVEQDGFPTLISQVGMGVAFVVFDRMTALDFVGVFDPVTRLSRWASCLS